MLLYLPHVQLAESINGDTRDLFWTIDQEENLQLVDRPEIQEFRQTWHE